MPKTVHLLLSLFVLIESRLLIFRVPILHLLSYASTPWSLASCKQSKVGMATSLRNNRSPAAPIPWNGNESCSAFCLSRRQISGATAALQSIRVNLQSWHGRGFWRCINVSSINVEIQAPFHFLCQTKRKKIQAPVKA